MMQFFFRLSFTQSVMLSQKNLKVLCFLALLKENSSLISSAITCIQHKNEMELKKKENQKRRLENHKNRKTQSPKQLFLRTVVLYFSSNTPYSLYHYWYKTKTKTPWLEQLNIEIKGYNPLLRRDNKNTSGISLLLANNLTFLRNHLLKFKHLAYFGIYSSCKPCCPECGQNRDSQFKIQITWVFKRILLLGTMRLLNQFQVIWIITSEK